MHERADAMKISFVIPGDLDQPTGGYGYARQIIAAWQSAGIEVATISLPGDFPHPSGATLEESARVLAGLDPHSAILVDGLAFGALTPAIIGKAPAPVNVLLHHPLGLEGDMPASTADRLLATERAALGVAAHVIVTSPRTASTVMDLFGLAASDITIALPGTAKQARARRQSDPPLILSVGSLIARKGHADLVDALSRISDLDWIAVIAGSLTASPQTVNTLRLQIGDHGLNGRITIMGAMQADALARLYQRASLFTLATHYEGYGMVFAEAMSYGLPVVACRGGAVADVVPDKAGILVEPRDRAGLAQALAAVLEDKALADRLAAGAYQCASHLPEWTQTAERIAKALIAPAAGSKRRRRQPNEAADR